jgi:two-component system, cell cycle response regulator DivK
MEGEFLKGKTLLIVEDDFSGRLYLNEILKNTGANLLNAVNGKDALDLVFNNTKIDIILMDIQLPVMDGYTSVQKIREFNKDIVIIAQTAFGLMSDREKIIASGFNDYIIKPVYAQKLFETLLTYLPSMEKN